MNALRRSAPLLASLTLGLALGCAPPAPPVAPPPRGLVRAGTPDAVDVAAARARGGAPGFAWRPWSAEALAEARREHKLVLIDGAAAWCHWCHVMDATTYRDPEIGRVLAERFVTIRFDADAQPDLAERYGAWGWPATIVLSPEAEELGKHRGYLPPDELRRVLAEAQAAAAPGPAADGARLEAADRPPPAEALPWVAGRALVDLDSFYDPVEGSWGRRHKAPIGANVEVELTRAAHGDAAALGRALFTLQKQRALLDPVWGGIYQYSTGGAWSEPHYEKLMTFQAANLEAWARAYGQTHDAALLADARRLAGYMSGFLSDADGAFLVSQDADVGGHDERATFVDGDVYYRLGDGARRALGMPRVDAHVYPFENGLALAAFAALYEVTGDGAVLARARRAADRARATMIGPDGAVRRRAEGPRFLVDAAALGRGLARLAEVTGEASYRDAAVAIGAALVRDLIDPASAAFWDHTIDPAAAGVFARRARPAANNALAARFLAALGRITRDPAWRDHGRRALTAVCTPRALDERGRLVGEIVLALDEVGALPWP
jgi:hypothetical protein